MKASFSHTSYMYRHTKLFWKSYYLLRPVQKLWEILISLVFTNNYITSKILALNIPLANFYLQLLEPTYFSLLSLKSFNLIQSSKSLIPPLSTILPTPPSYAHISPCLAQVPGSKFNHSLNCFSPCYSVFLVYFLKPKSYTRLSNYFEQHPCCSMSLYETELCRYHIEFLITNSKQAFVAAQSYYISLVIWLPHSPDNHCILHLL